MNIKRIVAAVAASALAVSALATSAFAVTLEKGQAFLAFGDADWKAAAWGKAGNTDDVLDNSYFKIVDVKGDGTYTVSVDLSAGYTKDGYVDEDTGDLLNLTTARSIGAMGINLNYDQKEDAYKNVICTITSVKFDGVEFALTGTSYTNAEDGMLRTNVYNAWAAFKPDEGNLSTNPDKATPTVIDIASLDEWTTCEVTFEVTGLGAAAADDATVGDTDVATDGSSKDAADTGVEGVAAIAGLALVATGAIIVAKKRK